MKKTEMRIQGKRLARIMATTVAILSSVACGSPLTPTPAPTATKTTGPISVVASINQWGSLAEQLGGSDVSVTSILNTTTVDPYAFEPKTSDISRMQQAQIIVMNGAGYDAWAAKGQTQGSTVVSAAEIVGATAGDNPHLWFSKDARNGMATELSNAFIKALPSKKTSFEARLATWRNREKSLEQSMQTFTSTHQNITYAATQAVAYYLMSDLGFKDATPKGYAQSSASGGTPTPTTVQEFQQLIENRKIDLLINDSQSSSNATNTITGTAGRSNIPVLDISEQLPKGAGDVTNWISSLVDGIAKAVDTKAKSIPSSSSSSQSPSPSGGTARPTTPSNQGQSNPGK